MKVPFDKLSQIAYKYGTDKCPQIMHPYTPYYYALFKDKKNKVKKVIEAGIGILPGMKFEDDVFYDRKLKRLYHKGASLKMWRDFFPNAQIFGFDKSPKCRFEDKRIKTFTLDERKEKHLKKLISETGTDIDIFIDDASHYQELQIELCRWIMANVQKNVIYIIEDVNDKDKPLDDIIESLSGDFDVKIPVLKPNKKNKKSILFVIRNK